MIGAAIAAGAAAGFASIPHCMGMCGPLATYAGARPCHAAPLRYHLGRLASYSVAGAIAGAGGHLVEGLMPASLAGVVLSLGLAAALAISALRLWRAPSAPPSLALTPLTKKKASPEGLVARLFRRVRSEPALVGAASALLPCGALAVALLIAAGSGHPLGGALAMLTFAAASALGLGAVAAFAAALTRWRRSSEHGLMASRILATALLVGALLLAIRPFAVGEEPGESCHDPRSVSSSPDHSRSRY